MAALKRIAKEIREQFRQNTEGSDQGTEQSPWNVDYQDPEQWSWAMEQEIETLEKMHVCTLTITAKEEKFDGDLVLGIHYPPDYPFKPFKLCVKDTTSDSWRKQIMLRPEIFSWWFPSVGAHQHFYRNWSPAITTAMVCAGMMNRLLSVKPLAELVHSLPASLPTTQTKYGALVVLLGTAGEAPPAPFLDASTQDRDYLFLLIDPEWVAWEVKWSRPLVGDTSTPFKDALIWTVRTGSATVTYCVLPIAYCPNRPEEKQALLSIIATLRCKGWTRVVMERSVQICVGLPGAEEVKGYDGGRFTDTSEVSWEKVPNCLRRGPVGATAGQYKGW